MERILERTLVAILVTTGAMDVVSSQEPQVIGCNQQLQTYINTQTNLTLEAIDQFKHTYSWNKFGLPWDDADAKLDVSKDLEYLRVCNEEEVCQRVLPQLPSPPYNPPSTAIEAGQQLAEILEYSQQYFCALEILFLDQSLHEDSFQQHLDEIYRHMDGLVRTMIYGMKQCGISFRTTNMRNLQSKVYRGANTVLRDQRAFRTIRQCHLGLHYIRQYFSLNDAHPLLR